MNPTISDPSTQSRADAVSSLAVKSLLRELYTTPKPGLVDRADCGAHRDMDFLLFLHSAATLGPYFRHCFLEGTAHPAPDTLFHRLRARGLTAEAAMFRETEGVNTHKGAIFSLGILCGALGQFHTRGETLSLTALQGACRALAVHSLEDFHAAPQKQTPSAGEAAYLRHGVTGARGEGARGFPSAFLHGYPALTRALSRGASLNDAGVAAFLHLLRATEDTNIIKRAGKDALEHFRQEVSARLEEDTEPSRLVAYAAELNRRFIAQTISPGGCADMLAMTFFLYDCFREDPPA